MGEILNNVRAQVLVDALPYIQKYNNKILVVKYGGNAMTNKELKQAVMDDIVLLSLVGVKVVLVHGGGPEISDMLKRLNIESKFIGGLRYTDEAAVDVVKMVLSGKVNKELVSLLTRTRGKALGMCGIDGHMLTAERKLGPNGEDLGFNDDVRRHVGKPLAFWSVDTKDWKTRNTASTVSATLNNIEDGDVVLMHDIYGETAAAVAQIVPSLVQQGYQLVTLSELTYYRGVEMENGMIVFNMHPANPNYKLPPDPDVPEPQTTPAPETETTTETVAAAGQ